MDHKKRNLLTRRQAIRSLAAITAGTLIKPSLVFAADRRSYARSESKRIWLSGEDREIFGRCLSQAKGGSAMCTGQIKRFLIGLFVALMLAAPGFAQTATAEGSASVVNGALGQRPNEKPARTEQRADKLTGGDEQDQPLSLIDVEMLKRAEDRSDALRAQLLDLQMKAIDVQARVDDLDYRLRPENIQQAFALVGSARPMDELREDLRERLESEKARTNAQLDLLAATQARLEAAIRDADAECARFRQRLRLLRRSNGCQDTDGATPGDGESSSADSR